MSVPKLPPAPGFRVLRIVVVLIAVGVLANSASVVVAFLGQHRAVLQIQQERRDSVRDSCVDQNARHDATLAALAALYGHAEEGASRVRVRQLEQGRKSTELLVTALAPRQNCAALVKSRINTQ